MPSQLNLGKHFPRLSFWVQHPEHSLFKAKCFKRICDFPSWESRWVKPYPIPEGSSKHPSIVPVWSVWLLCKATNIFSNYFCEQLKRCCFSGQLGTLINSCISFLPILTVNLAKSIEQQPCHTSVLPWVLLHQINWSFKPSLLCLRTQTKCRHNYVPKCDKHGLSFRWSPCHLKAHRHCFSCPC